MCLPIRMLGALLLCFSALIYSAPGQELEDRVFELPPDWLWMGQEQPDEGAAPSADPFAHVEPEKPVWLFEAERLASLPRFPHLIPALGPEPPHDLRGLLERIGITFGDKSLALTGAGKSQARHLLFVRNTKEQLANIDLVLDHARADGRVGHTRITFRWQEKFRSGRTRLLLERTLSCRHGQTAKFQRHRRNDLLEEIEIEVSLLNDGATVDINSACDLRWGRLRLKTAQQTLLTSGDSAPQRLATARGTRPGSRTELSVRAERCIDFSEQDTGGRLAGPAFADLTRLIAVQIKFAEQQPAAPLPDKGSDLFWLQELWGWGFPENAVPHTAASLAHLQSSELRDARSALTSKGVVLDLDDRAWYAPQSGLLYVHAGHKARILTAGFVEASLNPELRSVEGIFEATEDNRRQARPLNTRSLLVRSGQKASTKSPIQGAPDEQLEAEVWLTEDRERADFNTALNHYPVGRDTWSYWGQTNIGIDGKSTVPLVSGRSADSGGALRTISLRAHLSLNSWLTLVEDPVRKAEAIRQFEAALLHAEK